ncbi:hypothetical protein D4764_0280450 [Takifugu flavidus]|uniref:Uncharacterized protein n=1 Tax=Takifugu flavidus TaxID=433684 RepID=A0A5C6MDM3_9TELE|nr:hypothetical protein D4764_0280450 [Takifugu flavidus]
MEEVALAVGQKIGHSSIKSAARMNMAVVLFLAKVEQPAARITLSNVPLFISDEFLVWELSRHGKVVSPIRKMLSGWKSPLLRHVVSHHRQVHMILNNRVEDASIVMRRVISRACPSRVASDAPAAEPAATAPMVPPARSSGEVSVAQCGGKLRCPGRSDSRVADGGEAGRVCA